MDVRTDPLTQAIKDADASAFACYGSSVNPDIQYLTRFRTDDPVIFLKKPGERGTLIVGQMEYSRALRESPASVMTRAESGLLDYMKEEKEGFRAIARTIATLAGGKVIVPSTFPFGIAYHLESFAKVILDPGTVEQMRAVKSLEERNAIRRVQQAAEKAMTLAISMIRHSRPENGMLVQNDEILTSERVRTEIHRSLMEDQCLATATIVSGGIGSALPHFLGSGPLKPCEPIIIDLFPRDEATGYYTDMTRTVAKGEPESRFLEMYKAVTNAQDIGQSSVRPGITGAEVHQTVVDFLHDRGFDSNGKGFIHNLGHGVGLDVHELPSIGPSGGELREGNVITIEPGLYYEGTGGIRLENIGEITASGFECYTKIPREFII
jgi:Xaa-Pro aminopeptidase